MDAIDEANDEQFQQCHQRPKTSSPFRSPAPPLMATFEGVLSSNFAAAGSLEPGNLDSETQVNLAESSSVAAVSTVDEAGFSEDLEESGSSTSSSKRGRIRRRKKALYAKIRDQIAYYFSDANLRRDRFMRSLAGVEEENHISRNNNNQNNQKEKLKGGKKRKLDDEINWTDLDNNKPENIKNSKVTDNDKEIDNSIDQKHKNDPWSADHLSGCRPVPCSAFLAFNKIANLVGNKNGNGQQKEDEDIYRAFLYEQEWTAFGTALLFDAKNRTIARREPFNNEGTSDVNERVVYVEGFGSDQLPEHEKKTASTSETSSVIENADNGSSECDNDIYDLLKKTFEKHGTVLSIRTPRFRGTKQLMGFAFVEFAEKEAVERAVKHFKKLSKTEKKEVMGKPVTIETRLTHYNENKCNALSIETKEPLSKPKLQSDEDSIKRRNNSKQDDDVSQNLENTTNETESGKSKQKKAKIVQFENESTVYGENDNVASVNETKNETDNDKTNDEKLNKSTFDITQLRVLSKQNWNQYKNRYLKLQRNVASETNHFAMNDNGQCKYLLMNLDLSKKQQQLKKKTDSNNISKVSDQFYKNGSCSSDNEPSQQKVAGTTNSDSNIVQLVLQTNKAQAIESGRIRRNLRTFFETVSSKVADSNTELLTLPSISEIAFIDCEQGIHFQEDGSMQLTVFVRTHTADSAAKMVLNDDNSGDDDCSNSAVVSTATSSKNFRKLLNAHLNGNVILKKVILLDKPEIENYWALVNQAKEKNNYNNCNYNYQTNSQTNSAFRNGRK